MLADRLRWVYQVSIPVSGGTGIAGYALGGYNDSILGMNSSIEGILYSNLSNITVSGTLSIARGWTGGCESATNGYAVCGRGGGYSSTSTVYNRIDGFNFSTKASISVTATYTLAAYGVGACNSSTGGYCFGGGTGNVTYYGYVDGFTFSSGVAVSISSTLSDTRRELAGCNSDTHGYAIGGYKGSVSPNARTIIDKVNFSTNASSVCGYSLTTGTYRHGSCESSIAGYSYSGSAGVGQGFYFSTETQIAILGQLSTYFQTGHSPAGCKSSTNGYSMGGQSQSHVKNVDRFTFDTHTIFNTSSYLTTYRTGAAGVSDMG